MLSALLRPVRMPEDDAEPLDGGELLKFIAATRAWRDKAGTRAVATRERHMEIKAERAARRA